MSDNNRGHDAVRQRSEPEQIDLIDVLIQLWRGKLTLFICIAFTVTLTVGYLFTSKDKWTSTAIVVPPDAGQVADYANALMMLYSPAQLVVNAGSTNTFLPSISDVQINTFERFSAQAQARADAKGIEVQNIKPQQQQPIYNPLPLQLTYTADTAEQAKATLTQFVAQINNQVAADLSTDLRQSIASRVREIRESLDSQERITREQKLQHMAALNHALELAETTGITEPVQRQSDTISSDSLYLLGSKALKTILQGESGKPLSFSDEYYKTREKLLMTEAINPEKMQMSAFRYVMEPDTAQQTQNMKRRATILFIAVLFGGLLGSAIVLTRSAIRNYQQRDQA